MSHKYTEWMDPVTHPPVHVGWYQIAYLQEHNGKLSKFVLIDLAEPVRDWDGERWTKSKRHGGKAFLWRGLTAPHPDYKGE